MKSVSRVAVVLVGCFLASEVSAQTTETLKDGNGNAFTMLGHKDTAGNFYQNVTVCDPTTSTNCAPVTSSGLGVAIGGTLPAFASPPTINPAPTSARGGLSLTRLQVAANTTSVAVDASPGQLYGIEAFNNGSAVAYVKLYNAAQGSTTCGSGTVLYSGMIPAASSGGAGYISMNVFGIPFSTAITACVTTGFGDNDTTAPPASTYLVNFFYK